MLKTIHDEVWAFDAEWVPDVATGRRVYGLPAAMSDDAVMAHMWRQGGATASDPQPYLKTVLCRVVSVAAVVRRRAPDGAVSLLLYSLPELDGGKTDGDEPAGHALDRDALKEAELLSRFLNAIGKKKPQLVGYNSQAADLTILIQRALVHRVAAPELCQRPDKPWEGPDYFARSNDIHIDLRDLLSSWGKGTPRLHEIATACGIPGKLDTDGAGVVDLWRNGHLRRIVQYNQCDALTTYLLWLRLAGFAGRLAEPQVEREERQLEELLEAQSATPGNEHLRRFLEVWRALR